MEMGWGTHLAQLVKKIFLLCGRSGLNPQIGKIPWRKVQQPTPVFMGFPGGSDGKESTCNVGGMGSIPGLGRSPGGGHGTPLQCSCLENPHEQRNLLGYSPCNHRESDMTERQTKHNTAQHSFPQDHFLKFYFFNHKMGVEFVKCFFCIY